uniref:Uncharacterized protein n=1 Tax=uncultured bacterium 253 TaxID=698385 RepID=E3T733_9BACT|nr:hypothetical protein [uncultured bacterium 253]
MIKTVCLNSTTKKFTENCPSADISELRLEEGNIVWADVSDPTSHDFEELAEELASTLSQLKIVATSTSARR